nr:putative reverse transcriptase domain-containing protein [Tanacetum cinerariifolium]
MVNVISPNYVDDVPIVELDQHNDVPIIPEPVLVDEDEDSKEDEFEEEEDPQEGEDDMEVDIEVDKNEPELTYPYEEMDPLNPPPPAFELEPKDVTEVENPIENEYETVPASVYETIVWSRDGACIGREERKANDEFYGKLSLDLGNEVHSSVEQGKDAIEKLVEKPGNEEVKIECKKLKKELKEARGFVCKERPNEAIEVPVKDVESSSPKALWGNPESCFQSLHLRLKLDATPAVCECTFAGFMKCNPTTFRGTKGAVELMRWFEKTESVFGISECAEGKKVRFVAATLQGNSLIWWNSKTATMGAVELMRCFEKTESIFGISECAEGKKVRFVAATLQGNSLIWWNSKTATMGLETMNRMPWTKMKQLMTTEFCPVEEVQRMKHELWNLKVKEYNIVAYTQRFNELALMCSRMGDPERVKNNQRQGNGRAMVTAPTDGKLPLFKRCFTRHVGSDKSFVDTRFSSMLNIDLVKIGASYEVELANGRVVSTNTVSKGYTLNLVNHVFEIDLMPIEIGAFDVIIVKSDKGMSRLKVIYCIKARKYVKRGCHLFLAHVTKEKSKEKQMEDVPLIHDFPEVFPEELPGLPPPRQDEEEHEKHLKIILELLKKERFGVHVDPAKIEAIKSWTAPTTPTEMRQFLGLAGYYRRFIEGFSFISKPLTKLTQKNKKYEWGKEEEAFQILKQKLCRNYYHPGKPNVVADALSRKERDKPFCVRALMMTIHNDLPKQICDAQEEAMKGENVEAKNLGRLIKPIIEFRPNGTPCFKNRVWLPLFGGLRDLVMHDSHKSKHGVPVLIILDRDSHFMLRFWRSLQEALGTNLDMSTAYHPQTDGQSQRTIQTLEDMLRACVIDFKSSWDRHLPLVEFSYNNSYHASIKVALYKALYGRKYRSHIFLIKNHLLAARSRQKSYADKRAKPLEFEVGDMVLLKVSPWKGAVRFRKREKLSPRYIGPFKILARVGHVAYTLELLEELKGIHTYTLELLEELKGIHSTFNV